MITVAIEASLTRPAAIDGPLHLDALLSARHPAMHGRGETLTRVDGGVMIAPLPLAVARCAGEWVWCASAWTPPPAEGAAAIVKRRDGVDYRMLTRTIYPSVGPDRDRLMRFALRRGPLRFKAVVNNGRDIKDLRHLLRRITQVGGLRKAGYGVIDAWSVERVDIDPLSVLAYQGRAERVLPASMFSSDAAITRIAIHPPYWQTAEMTDGYDVGTRGEMCSKTTITSPRSQH